MNIKLENKLADSASAYLRAHKDNPVAWQEWNEETLSLAKTLQRPIFLSVGYNACHWCHVMEKESFSSAEVAAVLNESFIPIKLDREVRPDLDDIYINYVSATTGHGGWPLNVFLTPALEPMFGGTYWPGPDASNAADRRGSISDEKPLDFLEIVSKVKELWETQKEQCLTDARDITKQLQDFALEGNLSHSTVHIQGADSSETDSLEQLELDLVDDAFSHFVSRFDSINGGFSPPSAPKFPTPTNLIFLLRIGASTARPSTHTRFGFPPPVPDIVGKRSCATAAQMAVVTLLIMSRAGIRDHLAHGFHRYSVTPDWNLPHFEKMLYDNAQLLACYCDAWALGKNPEILGAIYDLVEYFTDPSSPIVHSKGGWYASEDADSHATPSSKHEKKEGSFYVWTYKEIQSVLGQRDAGIVARHFGVRPDGNVPAQYDMQDEMLSQNVLHISATPSVIAKEFGLPEEEIVNVVKSGKAKLSHHRTATRGRPDVDNKIITSWNALAIVALCRAASTLSTVDPNRAQRCHEAAERAASFTMTHLHAPATGSLFRIYSPNHVLLPSTNIAFIDDYAYLTLSFIALYDLTSNPLYLTHATTLQTYLDKHFSSPTGAYYQSATHKNHSDRQQIILLQPGSDNTLPSPNGIIASNLLYLSSYTSHTNPSKSETYSTRARNVLDAFAVEIIQHPYLYTTLLGAVVMEQVGVKSLLVPEDMPEEEARKFRGWGGTVVRDKGVKKVMVCDKGSRVCRELRSGELDGEWEGLGRGEGEPFERARRESAARLAKLGHNGGHGVKE